MLEKVAAESKKNRRALTGKTYSCQSTLAKELLAVGLAHCPNLSLYAAELLIPCIVASFLEQVGIAADPETLSSVLPKRMCLEKLIQDSAVSCCYDKIKEIDEAVKLYIASDKGNKKGLSHLVKILSWWCKNKNKVAFWTLDIDVADGTSEATAKAIDASMKKIDVPGKEKKKTSGSVSDAGGGGTGYSAARNIQNVGRAIDAMGEYLVATCSLHGLQLTLGNPILKCCGEGGLGKRTLLQMLHSAYNLQLQYETEEWQLMWTTATGKKAGAKMPAPVLTRWEYVGAAITHLLERWEEWEKVVNGVIQNEKTDTAGNQIASALYSLMNEPVLKAQLAFVDAYHKTFFDSHWMWLKHVDNETKEAAFLSVHMPVHAYVMQRDLKALARSWQGNNNYTRYKDFVSGLENKEEKQMMIQRFPSKFFDIAIAALTKHFDQWRQRDLLPLSLGGERETARVIAKWIYGEGTQVNEMFE